MKTRRTTEIVLETEETITIRGNANLRCPHCAVVTSGITLDQAMVLLGVDLPGLGRAIESGQLHSLETASGTSMICLESLRRAAPQLTSGNSKLEINPIKEI